jgi:2'-phosphotransferase
MTTTNQTNTTTQVQQLNSEDLLIEVSTGSIQTDSLRNLLGKGIAFVDNSGSTTGAILEALQRFTVRLAPARTGLWNSSCEPIKATNSISWGSRGGTSPDSIYRDSSWASTISVFVLLTDGQVGQPDVRKLSGQVHLTSHLPTILGIAGTTLDPDVSIARFNVSVLLAHYTAAPNAIIIVMDRTGTFQNQGHVWVLAAKGDFARRVGFCDLPDLGLNPVLGAFPFVSIDSIRNQTVSVVEPQPSGTVLVNDGRHYVQLSVLTRVAENFWDLAEVTSEEDIESVVRTLHTRGELAAFRAKLQVLSNKLDEEAANTTRHSVPSGPGVASLLSQLRHAKNSTERSDVSSRLLSSAGAQAKAEAVQRDEGRERVRSRRAIIGAALEAASVIERAGMGADCLGRLSNRAARSKKTDITTLARMDSLNLGDAPHEECIILLDEGPSALVIRAVPAEEVENNTNDFSLDFPLATGGTTRNDVWLPDVIGLESADQIEATQESALTREETVVGIPVLSLSSEGNRREMYKRFCIAFTGRLQVGNVWLIALASITHTIENKEWASQDTPVGRLLHYLGQQIMTHVVLKSGHKLAPDGDATIAQALVRNIGDDEFAQHQPLNATVTAAIALIRWVGPTSASPSHYRSCVIARANRCVPQEYLTWLKRPETPDLPTTNSLWESIYSVRASTNRVVPVAGGHHMVCSWEGVLSKRSRNDLDMFARSFALATGQENEGGDSLITPGLSLVVRAVISGVTPNHSSNKAIEATNKFHEICATEFLPNTVGVASEDLCSSALARWLVWARSPMVPLPPFATPYGPSVIFFYHGRTRGGGVTNMTDGYTWIENEPQHLRLTGLTEHIRTTRARLLHLEYNANPDGSFNKHTSCTPMYRRMWETWCNNPLMDPHSGEFVNAVVNEIMNAKTGNIHTECLEHEIAMLAGSMIEAGHVQLLGEDPPSLMDRLVLELAGRRPSDLNAPQTIWVPSTNPTIQQALAVAAEKSREDVQKAVQQLTQPAQSKTPTRIITIAKLSRFLVRLLRHAAPSRNLTIRPNGYVSMTDLLAIDELHGVLIEQVVTITEAEKKNRLQLTTEDNELLIRATQGHTIPSVDSDALMDRITHPDQIPLCIHGTYEGAWDSIEKIGLNRMQRNNIHMSPGLPDDPEVRSGIRTSTEVLIYINVPEAMDAGIPFYRSHNGVICSPGPIPSEFFSHVMRRSDGRSLRHWKYTN